MDQDHERDRQIVECFGKGAVGGGRLVRQLRDSGSQRCEILFQCVILVLLDLRRVCERTGLAQTNFMEWSLDRTK